MLVGSGGKAEGAATGIVVALSETTTGFGVSLDGTDMLSPAIARFSLALLAVGAT